MPSLTQAPRLDSSIVIPTSQSVSDQNDVDGDSSAPTEDTSNTSASVWPSPGKYKTDWTSSGETKGNTGVHAHAFGAILKRN